MGITIHPPKTTVQSKEPKLETKLKKGNSTWASKKVTSQQGRGKSGRRPQNWRGWHLGFARPPLPNNSSSSLATRPHSFCVPLSRTPQGNPNPNSFVFLILWLELSEIGWIEFEKSDFDWNLTKVKGRGEDCNEEGPWRRLWWRRDREKVAKERR